MVLLHGLGATSDYWPRAYDRIGDNARVVVPDLLGFGCSLDEDRSSFTVEDHLDALDSCVAARASGADRFIVLAHSMGTGLALGFAARHLDRVDHLICVGAPVYPDARSARGAFGEAGAMGRVFLLDTDWARCLCALSCRARTASGLLMALVEPRLPVAVARRASLHTWPAYRDTVEELILQHDWAAGFDVLIEAGIPIDLLHGSADDIGSQPFIDQLLGGCPGVSLSTVEGADHHLAITHSAVVLEHLGRTERSVDGPVPGG